MTARRNRADVPGLVEKARAGDARSVARLISLVEDASPQLREVMAGLAPHAGRAHVIGITGSPGVGKSTSTNALVSEFRRRGQRYCRSCVGSARRPRDCPSPEREHR